MPKQTQSVSLKALLGPMVGKAVAATKAHKGDATTVSAAGELPDGIEMGIARLVTCTFGKFKEGRNAGKPFFRAAGIVLEPKDVGGIPVEGLRTQLGPEPLCDTPDAQGKRKTFNDHWAWMLNQLRLLGVPTAELQDDPDAIESACRALETAKPTFRFRTWKGKPTPQFPNPRVNQEWRGQCQYDGHLPTTPAAAGVQDDSPQSDVNEEQEEQESEQESETPSENQDLSELAALATAQDESAAQKLAAIAMEAGIDKEQIENSESWDEVVTMIEDAQAGGGDENDDLTALGEAADNEDQASVDKLDALARDANIDPDQIPSWSEVAAKLLELEQEIDNEPAEPEVIKPVKGKVYSFKPPKARKAVDCECTAVFTDKCNLKNLDTQQSYKGVPFDKLEPGS